MSEVAISMQGVSKSYGKHKVLTDINIEINKGDIYGLIGKNGAGKTTLFKIILGLSEYQDGIISIDGEEKDVASKRRKIGFLIGSNFFDYMTAKENLEYYCKLKGIKDKNEVDRVLKIVGLDGVNSKFKGYSLGMRQRLGIANAILGNPEILIMDEPTNGLDPQGIADVRNLIQKLNEEYKMTIIVSSHILSELQHTAYRFGIVNKGKVVKTITQEELQETEEIVRISLKDLEGARKALKDAGIEILEEKQETKSLEEYYFDLVEGEENE